jgi:hypothetical protein
LELQHFRVLEALAVRLIGEVISVLEVQGMTPTPNLQVVPVAALVEQLRRVVLEKPVALAQQVVRESTIQSLVQRSIMQRVVAAAGGQLIMAQAVGQVQAQGVQELLELVSVPPKIVVVVVVVVLGAVAMVAPEVQVL